jgi:hypothetical protein
MNHQIAGAILLSSAGLSATAGGIAQQFTAAGSPCWESIAAALILGGFGLYLLLNQKSNQ